MVDVFEQVEEELRSERLKRLARIWLPVFGGVLLIALIAALSWWGWQSWETSKADKASAAYDRGVELLEQGNAASARTAFEEAADVGNGAYRALALMQQAGIELNDNRPAQAVTLFDQAADAVRDPIMADAAALKAAFLVMDTDASLADIEGRLTPLAGDGRPYRAFAQEALALARIQHGQMQPARDALVQLQLGQDVPEQVRQRAQAAIESIDSGTASALAGIVAAQASLPAPQAPAADAPGVPPAPANP
ncbi:tetratricopeptide repeat protein [Brevundimonas sp. S30B]|uniref:tetratricopeptide repeat protein n=1 Tax=unclassified Brevundimonas TaxID=2622653 RepID=UPI001071AADB|nr:MULTISPECIES: tetratricopeptide repeat protein [unclassified Brevundimonas]QBX37706.1 tetratricopeptide repeat protein [Brevundimonas sp. MF30-B]TFW00570.1 tetratricopeptide repeat protein [Brevundimonas sp. S30B]